MWRRMSLAFALVAALAAAAACRPAVRGNGRNVLLVTFETTRADHLTPYGYARETSPFLARLAAEGALFEHASSASPRTNPSLASIMTALYPHEHGVRNLLLPLEHDNRTLAEVLRDAGYRTAAVQTHPRLVRGSGFEQGFDTYDDDYAAHPRAEQACAAAERWIASVPDDRPWFVWIHLMDPHWTYDPPAAYRDRFGPESPLPREIYRGLAEHRLNIGPIIFENRMTAAEVQGFVDLYDAEIRATDDALAGLVRSLDVRGVGGRTVVVMTADHGESLGEHAYFFEHGDFGTEPEIHVPLIVSAPDRWRGGVRVPASVSTLDVAPTVVDLVGLPEEPEFRGRSLAPVADGSDPDDRLCFGETGKRFHDENRRRAVDGVAGKWRWVRRGRFKLVYRPLGGGRAERVLYDLELDPGETADCSERDPTTFRDLSAALDEILSEDDGHERDYHITPEAREMLRSLGYVD